MKIKYFQRLNTRLHTFPILLMLIAATLGGIGFYFFGYPFLFKKHEITEQIVMLSVIYFAFVGVVILIAIIQSAYITTKLITRPIFKLVNAARSVAMGNMSINLGKDYKGELLELKKSFESMIEKLKDRESALQKNINMEKKEKAQLKSMFFAGMSNELKTPLNLVTDDIKMILDKEKDLSTYKKTLEGNLDVLKNMLHLMDDFLEFSKLAEKKFVVSPEEFYLCELLEEVENTIRDFIGTKEIELIVECHTVFMDKSIYTDRHRLKQTLENLLSNAIRSTDVGTVTMLLSEVVRDGMQYIEVIVSDTGRGIEPHELSLIFDEFSYYPLSIRLAISKKLIYTLGGKIEVESKVGKGSVFTVTIPVETMAH